LCPTSTEIILSLDSAVAFGGWRGELGQAGEGKKTGVACQLPDKNWSSADYGS